MILTLKTCLTMTPSGSCVKSFKSLGKLIDCVTFLFLGCCHKTFNRIIFSSRWCRPIKLVVAKCWDPNPKGYFTIPRTEPVRPIDPGAWVAHTEAARGGKNQKFTATSLIRKLFSLSIFLFIPLGGSQYPNRPPSVATMSSTATTIMSSQVETERKPFSFSPSSFTIV